MNTFGTDNFPETNFNCVTATEAENSQNDQLATAEEGSSSDYPTNYADYLKWLSDNRRVLAITHWCIQQDQRIVPIQQSVPLPPEMERRVRLLLQTAARERRVSTRVLSKPTACHLVVVPVPHNPQHFVSIFFALAKDDSRKQTFELHVRDATELALHVSLSLIDQPAAEDSTTESSNAPHLRQIVQQVKRYVGHKLRAAWESRLALTAVVATVSLLGALPWPHYVRCQVSCEPLSRRFVAAPFDTKLLAVHTKAGDEVEAGQLLAELDGSNLRSKLAGLKAKLSQATQKRFAAMSQSDGSEASMQRLEIEYLQREIEILEDQQKRLNIRSPIDGVVVTGDLERSEGGTLKVGEAMFEIAPLDELIAEVAIPESEVTFVDAQMPVSIHLDALPGQTIRSTVNRIYPRNELVENESVFVAYADIPNVNGQLRPGMNGVAHVEAGWQPIFWLLFHRPYESIRETLGW